MAKPFYCSFNDKELATLDVASHEETALYLILKRLADFKTGSIGKHPQSKTNCQKIADKLSRPASQGKSAINYDRKHIDRLLTRMQLRGLVIRYPYDDENLVLDLPMSPINYAKKDGSSKTTTTKETPNKLPQQATGAPFESLADIEEEPFDTSLSVMNNTDNNINTINTPNNDNTWGDDFDLEADSNVLTLAKIKELIASKGTVLYPDSETSNAIYQGWLKSRVTEAELIKAIETASENFTMTQTPNDIDGALKQSRSSKSGSRGLVL